MHVRLSRERTPAQELRQSLSGPHFIAFVGQVPSRYRLVSSSQRGLVKALGTGFPAVKT
jgi:hypothetical protein